MSAARRPVRTMRLLGTTIALVAASPAALGQAASGSDGGDPNAKATASIDPNAKVAAASIPFIPDALVDELARRLDSQRRASERATNPVLANPRNRSLNVSLGPGDITPVVQTVMGYTTTIAFLDSTGQPWPIHWQENSNPSVPVPQPQGGVTNASAGAGVGVAPAVSFATGFDIAVPVKGGNMLTITTRSPGPRGSIAVILEGANAPLSFMLMGNSREFDSQLAVMVKGHGPNAKAASGVGFGRSLGPVTGAAQLTSMLDGVAPSQAVPLGVSGMSPDDIRAWRLGDRIYLRTRARVVSPQPIATEKGMDGVAIFEIPAVPSVLVTSGGQLASIHLQER